MRRKRSILLALFLLSAPATVLYGGESGSIEEAARLFDAGDLAGARANLESLLETDDGNLAALYYLGIARE
jgi:predicted negative regulator of RcsB-dependent stress response